MTIQRDGNLAFKCTYNDGGGSSGPDDFLGFHGTCSMDNIARNIRAGRVWCSSPDNECRQWYDSGFEGEGPPADRSKGPCYESGIFFNWKFGPGICRHGPRAGRPISMNGAQKGKVVLLTTRLPDQTEEDRIIFGLYKIKSIKPVLEEGTFVVADKQYTLRVPREAAIALPYWSFKDAKEKLWGTLLFRYLSNEEVSNYRRALRPYVARSPRDREVVDHLLTCAGSPSSTSPRRLPIIDDQKLTDREIRLKYAPGGEGPRHRKLKEYVAKHPEKLGFGPGTAKVEHRFITADRADVTVALKKGGRHLAVEIEVEGADPTLVGAHQALKYQALLSAEKGPDADCHAVLVAYSIPKSTREFCDAYGIRWFEMQPE